MTSLFDFLKSAAGSVDIEIAAGTFFSKKISRFTGDLWDNIGEQALSEFIQADANIIDYIPEEARVEIKSMLMPYAKFIQDMQVEFIYNSMPDRHIYFFENTPNGVPWVLIQLTKIKSFLTS